MSVEKKSFLIEISIEEQKMQNYKKIQKLNFFKRNFRKIQKGSLRGSIFTLLKFSLGIGFFTVPYNVKYLGILNSILIITFQKIHP